MNSPHPPTTPTSMPKTSTGSSTLPTSARVRRHRQRWDKLFVAFCIFAACVSIATLLTLLISIGYSGFSYLSWDFLTSPPSRKPHQAGIYPAMAGSVFICMICALTAIPIGVATAILLEEFKPSKRFLRKLHGFIQLNITNLAGVPSVVYGIVGLTVFVGMFGYSNHAGQGEGLFLEFGRGWYDEFYDDTGQLLQVAVNNQLSEPTQLREGLMATDEASKTIAIHVVEPDQGDGQAGTVLSDELPERVDMFWPWYFRLPLGRGVLAGGLTLMLVVLPVVIIATQESLRAVPNTLRQGALGLGATRWQMVWRMTLPAAVPGIMTGTILAISRAIGEAAPILIISGTLFIRYIPEHLMDDFTAMPLQIYNWAGRPNEEFHHVAGAGIIVLLSILLFFNGIAVLIRHRFQKPLS